MGLLFETWERRDSAPAEYGEDTFHFLNRVAGPYWDRVRAELDHWYEGFPDDDDDLRRRFRSPAQDQHDAAWWELYLHRLFSCVGFEIQVHPQVESGPSRPDFRLAHESGVFYLEAVTVFSGIVEAGRHRAREAEVLDALNSIDNGSFFVMVEFDHVGGSSPRRRAIIEPVASWLAGLDPGVVEQQLAAAGEVPHTTISVGDWTLDLRAFPAHSDRRNMPDHRLIGGGLTSVGAVNDQEQLAKALRRKRKRYGDLGQPLVVAALARSLFMEDRAVEQVLLGSHAVKLPRAESSEVNLVREVDGIWTEKRGRPGARMSALLMAVNVSYDNLVRMWPRLWKNPWATRELDISLPFPTWTVVNDQLVYAESTQRPSETFRLSVDWPGPDKPFPRA